MNNISKLILSDEEQELVTNQRWILTKRVIIDKIQVMMGQLSDKQKAIVLGEKDWLPEAVLRSESKISKGENYLQLPYLILDYPRCFEDENIFAVRTMFWWGNFFSITLHLSGSYKKKFEEKIIDNIEFIQQQDAHLNINESQWHHHFEKDNYQSLISLSVDESAHLIRDKKFIKLAINYPLENFENLPDLLEKRFADIVKWLGP